MMPNTDWKHLVQKDGYRIRDIEEQTEELCFAAVTQNGWAIRYCKV